MSFVIFHWYISYFVFFLFEIFSFVVSLNLDTLKSGSCPGPGRCGLDYSATECPFEKWIQRWWWCCRQSRTASLQRSPRCERVLLPGHYCCSASVVETLPVPVLAVSPCDTMCCPAIPVFLCVAIVFFPNMELSQQPSKTVVIFVCVMTVAAFKAARPHTGSRPPLWIRARAHLWHCHDRFERITCGTYALW